MSTYLVLIYVYTYVNWSTFIDSCSCNKLIEGINNLQFTELCKGPPGPLPCQCSNSKCEVSLKCILCLNLDNILNYISTYAYFLQCNYPYKSLTTSEALCTLDSDGDGIPDSDVRIISGSIHVSYPVV